LISAIGSLHFTSGNNTNTASMNIGPVNVYSSAKDASGIAGDVHAEFLKRNAVVQNGNSGPS
jgi:hypothetical protein